jgi:hypothetical protein
MDYAVGDIVCLSSHPYTSKDINITIGGESQLLSPLMVVTESLKETKNQFDEESGLPIAEKNSFQCKCIWFSTKSFQFEEANISSRLLRLISKSEANTDDAPISIGSQVALKTLSLELGKKKSSIKIEGHLGNSSGHNTTITPLLTFVSPVLHVLTIVKNNPKTPEYDAKTGEKKRFISKTLAKCKWFNPDSNKLSERLIPIEALTVIPPCDNNVLEAILDKIKNKASIKLNTTDGVTIISPLEINYRSGYYFIRGYDFVLNQIQEFPVSNQDLSQTLESPFVTQAPNFAYNSEDITAVQQQYLSVIETAKAAKLYVQIKYKNQNDKISVRTISNYELITGGKENKEYYLRGYCNSKKAERTFKLERIQKIGVLPISF